MTGSATHAAALKARAKALDVAASLLQATPDELDIVDGIVVHRDRPGGGSISLPEPVTSHGRGRARFRNK